MVTRIHPKGFRQLYLREHRKERKMSAVTMAGRLNIARESVLRLEREWKTRCTPEIQQQYADALGVEPEELWRPPTRQRSLDAIVSAAPEAVQDTIRDVVLRLVAGGKR